MVILDVYRPNDDDRYRIFFRPDAIPHHWMVEVFLSLDNSSAIKLEHKLEHLTYHFDKQTNKWVCDKSIYSFDQKKFEAWLTPKLSQDLWDSYNKL